ncbi:hypothetical protein L3Q82_013109 [Scortum barcoo]|uniref:Uncharacterized protein n=1 Tax=Scortum barcoo TaxID=214431 RepID=A0ACB8W095_9TELE|nr:hypothetical protein L3Q82_013109 [Scortum barcoo]
MWSVYWTVVVKKELSRKAKLSIYRERTRSRIQAAESQFPPQGGWRSLRDRVRSSVARSRAAAPSHREESAEVARASVSEGPGRLLPREVFQACPTGRRPQGRLKTRWRDYVSRLAWERLGVPPEELGEEEEVSGVREVLGISAQTAAFTTWSWISGRR